jgi:hypothetical protein
MRSIQYPSISPGRDLIGSPGPGRRSFGIGRWNCARLGLVFAVALACSAQEGHPVAPSAITQSSMPEATASEPAPNAQSTGESQKPTIPAESPRRSQIAAESTQLLAMAVELKAAVDKTNKDTLSLNVIRKADAIEKLAKTVRGKTKQGTRPG